MRKHMMLLVGLSALLAGCNQNTAIGNDREAELDPPAEAAAIEPASNALQGVATALVKPETMSDADIAAIGGDRGRCVFRLTEVGFPTFVYQPDGSGIIKLNGKLIPVEPDGTDRFTSGELLVTTRMLDDEGNAGLQALRLIVVPPGAKDELGFDGYTTC